MRTLRLSTVAAALLATTLALTPASAQDKPKTAPTPSAPSLFPAGSYVLDQFGPVASDADAKATFEKAETAILAAGGGVLVIPANTAPSFTAIQTVQHQLRFPAPPAPASQTWRVGPGITVIDLRQMGSITTPMARGFAINRTLKLPMGESLPHWGYQPMIQMNNVILRGSNSYRDWLQEAVPGGKDQKFYVPTIRGIFPGEFLNTGDYSGVERIYVKSLGFDKAKNLWYFVADTNGPLAKGAMIHNKNHTNLVRMDTFSHNENQTFDFMLWRHNYSQGDTYLMDLRFKYMSDVHSTAGDENGVIYAGFVEADVDPFQGKVKSFNPTSQELVFTDAKLNNTLGSGRPIINLSPKKVVTAGKVRIVRPSEWWDIDADPAGNGIYQGKTYPTTLGKDKIGQTVLRMGGIILLSKDAPVTQNHVGWYFGVTEPAELVPTSNQVRWYLIDSITQTPDGSKEVRIIRHWWGAKSAGSPTLYKDSSYTTDAKDRPLSYMIAPGSNAYDVSEGVSDPKSLIRIAPSPVNGTPNDFEPGDPIVQAIGPDPFRPITMRSWIFEAVPGAFPAPMMDFRNTGHIQRESVFTLGGGTTLLSEIGKRYDQKAPWKHYFVFDSAAERGLSFNSDVAKGIVFAQPGVEAPIVWNYGKFKEATLAVTRDTGVMKVQANGLEVGTTVSKVAGLSGSSTPSSNLRGVNVKVDSGKSKITIKFTKPEPDAEYAVFIETTWLTGRAITEQTPEGFTVEFEKSPAKDAKLHWLLVR
jgi:hypothetical protein